MRFAMSVSSGAEKSIFQGIEITKQVGNDPEAFLAVVEALASAITPVYESPDEDDSIPDWEKKLSKCEGFLQPSQWEVSLEAQNISISTNPRQSAFDSCTRMLPAMYANSRSRITEGLSLPSDSISIIMTIDHVKDDIKEDVERRKVF
jgi:hypothetical protein